MEHAEEAAAGVFQHTKVIIRAIRLAMTLGSDFEQSFHLSLSVVGVEVKVQPIPTLALLMNLIQRYIRISSFKVTKNNPSTLRRVSGDIVERLLPERQHLVELITIYND